MRMLEPKLYCYRQTVYCAYDEEAVWSLVQRHNGFLSIRGDCIDYWIPSEYRTLLVLAYPKLTRQPSLDYL